MTERLPALETRVDHLQSNFDQLKTAVTDGLQEIKALIRQEISDLKTEQLKDIKATIDRVERDLNNKHDRIADDQRRLWERLTDLEKRDNLQPGLSVRVTELEKRENQRTGGSKALGALWLAISGIIGAFLTMILSRLLPPPH